MDKGKSPGLMFGLFMSLLERTFFGGIGGGDFELGGGASSNWIKGVVILGGERELISRSEISFLGGGRGRVLREAAGEGGDSHRW